MCPLRGRAQGTSDCILLAYRAFFAVSGPDYLLRILPPNDSAHEQVTDDGD